MLAGKNLIIRFLYLGKYGLFACISGSAGDRGINIYKGANETKQVLVEISQELPFLLVEGSKVVSIIFKKRRLSVAAQQSIPMQVSPIAMIADTDIAHQSMRFGLYHWDTQCQRALWTVYHATVTEGLLAIMVVNLQQRPILGTKEG